MSALLLAAPVGDLDLTVQDPDRLVQSIEFAKKTDAGGYGAFASAWDRSAGTAGTTEELTRGEDVTLTGKHNVSIAYRLTYDDGRGAKTLEGAHSFDADRIAEVTNITVDFDANGQASVSATGDEDAANLYVTVGDSTTPSDPTVGVNDGSISGRSGTVDTGVKITTGNEAVVKVVAADSGGTLGPVQIARQARRLGPFHHNTTVRSHTGDTLETELERVTIPAGTLGTNGSVRIELRYRFVGTASNHTLRVKLNTDTIFGFITTSAPSIYAQVLLFNDGATNAQRATGFQASSSGSVSLVNNTTLAEDSTADMDIVITAELGNGADQIDLELTHFELIGTK